MFHIHITLCIQYISLCLSLRAERPLHPYSFPHKLQRQASVLLTLQTDFAFKKKSSRLNCVLFRALRSHPPMSGRKIERQLYFI